MHYLSVKETAVKWGISTRRVEKLCKDQRIDGVIKIGEIWAIPPGAEKPKDARIKTGRYVKKKETAEVAV